MLIFYVETPLPSSFDRGGAKFGLKKELIALIQTITLKIEQVLLTA
jgi:hypothetical protein